MANTPAPYIYYVFATRWAAFSSLVCAEAVDRFAHFLRFKTVSNEDVEGHVLFPAEFEAAHHFLNQSFPVVYSTLAVEQVHCSLAVRSLPYLAYSSA